MALITSASSRVHRLAILLAVLQVVLLTSSLPAGERVAVATSSHPRTRSSPTDSASVAPGLIDGAMGWALIILAAAMLIVSGAWLIRRQRLTRM